MLKSHDIINIILHVFLISSFIGIFFFTYASKVEEQVVKDQMDILANDLVKDFRLLPDSARATLRDGVANIKLPDMSHEDDHVAKLNADLMNQVMKMGVVATIIALGVIYYLYKQNPNVNMKEIITINLIVLAFVAVTEYIILTAIGTTFVSIDIPRVKKGVFESLEKISIHSD